MSDGPYRHAIVGPRENHWLEARLVRTGHVTSGAAILASLRSCPTRGERLGGAVLGATMSCLLVGLAAVLGTPLPLGQFVLFLAILGGVCAGAFATGRLPPFVGVAVTHAAVYSVHPLFIVLDVFPLKDLRSAASDGGRSQLLLELKDGSSAVLNVARAETLASLLRSLTAEAAREP